MSDALAAEFEDTAAAFDLFDEFLRHDSYSRDFALSLLARAGLGSGLRWETRRLAVLMLENQLLKLAPDDTGEWSLFLTRLGLKTSPEAKSNVRTFVLKEGYSTTEPQGFIAELRRRLTRLERVHASVGVRAASPDALLDFARLSRRECKLTLARYVFTPEEVVGRILALVKTSKGVADIDPFMPHYVEEEAAHALEVGLPDFEAAILKGLCETARVYWVSDATGSELNSLAEYPLTTVVLVVKPPGSCIEFEFKRAGRRGPHPLGVVYRRANGDAVPPSHRLDGGSGQEGLRYETRSAARLSRVFRLAHGREGTIPQYLSRASIHYVPAAGEQVSALDYFSDPELFGEGFREMRGAMDETVAAFGREYGANLPEAPGVVGRTMEFLTYATPGQAVLAGTSSFRLDRLAAYLSPDGAETYFTKGLKSKHSTRDARRLADEVLEEVLCVYSPPRVSYRSYGQYVGAAFRVAENRARADRNFLSVLRQVGTFWGTLFAIRGHSMGESFVARNVGLRSVWERGRWRIHVIFMDHDNLQTNECTPRDFQAVGILKSLSADDVFIWGGPDDDSRSNNEMRSLKIIYRPSAEVVSEGKRLFHVAALAAYRATHAALEREPGLRPLFDDAFLDRIRDWDAVIAGYLRARVGGAAGLDAWRKESRAALKRKGYEAELVRAILLSVETYGDFLAKYGYLFAS
jgi:hypothetical protein